MRPIEINCTPISSSMTLRCRSGLRIIDVPVVNFKMSVAITLTTPSSIAIMPADPMTCIGRVM